MTFRRRSDSPRDRAVVRAGFMPLIDAAPLIAAARCGFAAAEGIELVLMRETSWATLRDRISVRHLDVAHMLAPMPIAANLGMTPLPCRLIAPLALGSGGNTITVSRAMWNELHAAGATADFDALRAGQALASLVVRRNVEGAKRLTIAVVHPHSAHRYQLAYWLGASGIDASRDIELVVVPPALMPAALAGGQIDAFTAGEPWGTRAVADADGVILTTNIDIWRGIPEKVLGVRQEWAAEAPDRLARLLRAVHKAAAWCDMPANRTALADILAGTTVLDMPAAAIAHSLAGDLPSADGTTRRLVRFLSFADGPDSVPSTSHALLFLAQMVRSGDATLSTASIAAAGESFRPDIRRAALADVTERSASEPAPVLGQETFFDGRSFDPKLVADGGLGFIPPLP